MNAARRPEEQLALKGRYQAMVAKATTAGKQTQLREYEEAVSQSEPVVSRTFGEVLRLSYSEDEIYATFYQRVDAGLRLAGGDSWDRARSIADTILFGDQNKRLVRFASLTLDETGLPHYGDCSLLLRSEMVGHRASVFEENSVMFMHTHNTQASDDFSVPSGYRATWDERAMLAVAKLDGELDSLASSGFSYLLQHAGADERSDVFVEVHIWGSLTIRSVRKVTVRAWKTGPPSPAEIRVVTEKLTGYGIDLVLPAPPDSLIQ